MPVFSYSAVSGGGDSVSGELAAEHERAALRELKRRGLTPLSLAVAARSKGRSFRWSKRANLEDHIRLTNELAILVEAGVNLNEAIEIASRSSVYHALGDALGNVSPQCIGARFGPALKGALSAHGPRNHGVDFRVNCN